MKQTKILFFLTILIFLQSCSSFEDVGKVMRNEKIRTTDEFLIEKRQPLTLPPKFEELPTPGSRSETKKENKVNEILNMPTSSSTKETQGSSSVEKSIINKIGK